MAENSEVYRALHGLYFWGRISHLALEEHGQEFCSRETKFRAEQADRLGIPWAAQNAAYHQGTLNRKKRTYFSNIFEKHLKQHL